MKKLIAETIMDAGGIPQVVMFDNGTAFSAPGVFAQLGITGDIAAPYQARSKRLERCFHGLGK